VLYAYTDSLARVDHWVALARNIHECRRETFETEARWGFSQVRLTEVYAQSVEEVEREQPRRARGSDDVAGIHDKSGLEASGRSTRRPWAHCERIDPIGRA
jgi:hypothetical protein